MTARARRSAAASLAWLDDLARCGIMHHDLSDRAVRLLTAIGRRMEYRSMTLVATDEDLAEWTHRSPRTVWQARKEAEFVGYLVVKRKGRRRGEDFGPSVYRLTTPACTVCSRPNSSESATWDGHPNSQEPATWGKPASGPNSQANSQANSQDVANKDRESGIGEGDNSLAALGRRHATPGVATVDATTVEANSTTAQDETADRPDPAPRSPSSALFKPSAAAASPPPEPQPDTPAGFETQLQTAREPDAPTPKPEDLLPHAKVAWLTAHFRLGDGGDHVIRSLAVQIAEAGQDPETVFGYAIQCVDCRTAAARVDHLSEQVLRRLAADAGDAKITEAGSEEERRHA